MAYLEQFIFSKKKMREKFNLLDISRSRNHTFKIWRPYICSLQWKCWRVELKKEIDW